MQAQAKWEEVQATLWMLAGAQPPRWLPLLWHRVWLPPLRFV
jgi:hypothetical protein